MTDPSTFARDRPAHPLDHWASPELARVSPPNAPSRLRQLADAQAARAAAWSAAIAAGPVLLLAGAFISARSGNPAWVLALGAAGVLLAVPGTVAWKRVRATLPATGTSLVTRGPGSARGGIMMVAVLAVVLGAILGFVSPGIAARGGSTLAAVAGAYVLLVALLVACILVPSVVLGRGRQSFRRRIGSDPRLRAAVEADLANWRDPRGAAGYGPL
ncbi:hypothetical protein [Arthrobacter sp. BPSS-3]|uniref:hypothetical protein n=1 Tax=Arthrobacter sp. BPSS-3 TaxID=3366580 RepID=UPI0037DCE20C